MVNNTQLQLAQTDIYLIDQIIKGRYLPTNLILDAGCGSGRNLHWFLQHRYQITGCDINENAIEELKTQFAAMAGNFIIAPVECMPFADNYFNDIICSAVLHFAKNTAHFNLMIAEIVRVLKPGGSLFIRMTSDIGIEDRVELIADGVYLIPDGSTRFLLNRKILADCMLQHQLSFIEPLKTVNVNDVRCMSTLVLNKN
jgi:tellurite methyltransferase